MIHPIRFAWRHRRLVGLVPLLLLQASFASAAEELKTGVFLARVYRVPLGEVTPYRLFIPVGYRPGGRYPLVLWLHGSGSKGDDNRLQISSANRLGSQFWARRENQARYPAFVLVPQTRDDWLERESWEPSGALRRVIEIIQGLQKEFDIDPARIYVAGQSMGGFGTWAAIVSYPDMFAAAVPLCGGGDPSRAAAITRIPVWAFHGEKDVAVPVEQSRRMIQALTEAGGQPKYTEYKGVGHEIWSRVFREKGLLDWVFAQRRLDAKSAR